MTINWGLGAGNNALAMFQQGTQMGSAIADRRDRREQQNALLDIRREELEARKGEAATKQQDAVREKATMLARIFAKAEESPEGWNQALGAAKQMQLDTSLVPPQYDPAWARSQRLIAEAMVKGGQEAISGLAREFDDAGVDYTQGEGQAAFRRALEGKYGVQYTDDQGNTRKQRVFDMPEVGAAAPQGVTFTPIDGGPTPPASAPFPR